MQLSERHVSAAIAALLGLGTVSCGDALTAAQPAAASMQLGMPASRAIASSPYGCGLSKRSAVAPNHYDYTTVIFHGEAMRPRIDYNQIKLRFALLDAAGQTQVAIICTVPDTPHAVDFITKRVLSTGAKPKSKASDSGIAIMKNEALIPSGLQRVWGLSVTAPWTYYDSPAYWYDTSFFGDFSSHYDTGGGSGPYYDPMPDPTLADCTVDATAVPVVPMDQWPIGSDDGVVDFDCLVVRCPAAITVLNNANVVATAKSLVREMQNDAAHVERGAWIFYDSAGNITTGTVNADSTASIGTSYTGTNVCNYGPSCVPQLSWEPPVKGYAIIGSVHSHPYEASQSGPDMRNAQLLHDYSIVATRKNLYMLDYNGAALYQCPRQAWGACQAP